MSAKASGRPVYLDTVWHEAAIVEGDRVRGCVAFATNPRLGTVRVEVRIGGAGSVVLLPVADFRRLVVAALKHTEAT